VSSHLFQTNGIVLRGRWREELETTSAEGKLIFEFTMGREHVYFPDQARWQALAPPWAKAKWQPYLEACRAWCKEYRYPLSIVADAHFYEEK
jgi:hypothetical protein